MRSRTLLVRLASLSLALAAGAALVGCSGDDSSSPLPVGDAGGDGATLDAGAGDASASDGGTKDGGDAGAVDDASEDASDGGATADGGDVGDASDAGTGSDGGDGGDASAAAEPLVPGATEILGILPDHAIVYRDANGVSALLPFQGGVVPITESASGPTGAVLGVYGPTVLVTSGAAVPADAGACGALLRVRTWTEGAGFTDIAPTAYLPAASNDGSRIAFTATDSTCTARTLTVTNADGSGATTVATSLPCAPDSVVTGGTIQATYSCAKRADFFSGPGFATKATLATRQVQLDPSGNYAVAIVAGQQGLYRVADGTLLAGNAGWQAVYPDPTGTYAAVQNADGSMARITYAAPSPAITLVAAPGFAGGPLFAPDGSTIAFAGTVNTSDSLPASVVKSDGSSPAVQVYAAADLQFISADSRYLVVYDRNAVGLLVGSDGGRRKRHAADDDPRPGARRARVTRPRERRGERRPLALRLERSARAGPGLGRAGEQSARFTGRVPRRVPRGRGALRGRPPLTARASSATRSPCLLRVAAC